MGNENDLKRIEEMIDYFSRRGDWYYVSTLLLCKYSLFPELMPADDHQEKTADEILEELKEAVIPSEVEKKRRVEILPAPMEGTTIISLGTCGHGFVNRTIDRRWWPGCNFVSVDWDSEALSESAAETKFLLEIGLEQIETSLNNSPLELKPIFIKIRPQLVELLKKDNRKNVIIVFNAAGHMSDLAEEIVALCYEIGVFPFVACFMPFSFESEKRRNHAMKIKTDIEKEAFRSIFLENDEVYHFTNKRTTMPYAIGILQDIMAERISRLFSTTLFGNLR